MVKIHLSRLLGEKRWTQKDLADATGIRPSTINEWYHELVPRLNVDHIDKICEAYVLLRLARKIKTQEHKSYHNGTCYEIEVTLDKEELKLFKEMFGEKVK